MSLAIVRRAAQGLKGSLTLPGDKSISQRRALMSLLVDDEVVLSNYGTGTDCQTALDCIEILGKQISRTENTVRITGSINCNSVKLDCGNSGTTARLLMGILTGFEGTWTLTGDESLSQRPMERVAAPLRQMGAQIELDRGHLPAIIRGGTLQGIAYDSPVVSAQVKTAVLLAGLKAKGKTRYRESMATRDHTERMLGIQPDENGWITLDPHSLDLKSSALSSSIPADPSTAAFWVIAALLVPDSEIIFNNLLLNPHRIAYLDLLRHAGAKITFSEERVVAAEPVGTLRVIYSQVNPFCIRDSVTAQVLDEIPALAVLSSAIIGKCEFLNAGELRIKESDRLDLIVSNLRRMGAIVEIANDGFSVQGQTQLSGSKIETKADHRIAMAFTIAGLAAEGETTIQEAECVSVSYPEFWNDLMKLAPGSLERS